MLLLRRRDPARGHKTFILRRPSPGDRWSAVSAMVPRIWPPAQPSAEIVGECRFVRLADQPDTADLGVTVVDAWQSRGLGSALLARLSERALEAGIEYFTAEVLAENRTALALLPALGRVETESAGPVVTARVEIAAPPRQTGQEFPDLLTAAARGDIVGIPVLIRRLIRVPDGLAHIVRLPVSAVLKTLRPGSSAD
jgi:GNAT superfamily N-acetyltransferase